MIQYGRELRAMCEQLKRQYGLNEANEKALKVFRQTLVFFSNNSLM